MKIQIWIYTYILMIASFINTSCDNSSEQNLTVDNSIEEPEKEEVDSSTIDFDEELDDVNSESPFFLDDFPKVWIKLTCHDDGEDCHIYHYCEAELQQIWIETEKGENYYLTILYGQDSEQWKIENFYAVKKTMEFYQVVQGSFDLVDHYGADNKKVEFTWNQDQYFCNFSGIYDSPFSYYVPEQDRSQYEEIHEDCSGLWE